MKTTLPQLHFLLEVEKLKEVYRKSFVIGTDRRENSAEHSWHVCLMAIVLVEYSNVPVDLLRVLKMLVVHDIVEIDAGDTFHYHKSADNSAEAKAAERIFGLLPSEQAIELRTLWEEFEALITPEAKFARAVDRIWPVIQNIKRGGGTWKEFGIEVDAVLEMAAQISGGSAKLSEAISTMVEQAERDGCFDRWR